MTKKIYNQPEVQTVLFASMSLMQAASPAAPSGGNGVHDIETDDQW